MKIKEIKHNHSLTDLLKICIFSILMIAPLFASISQMLYVTVNKNAYQSYQAEKTYSNMLISNTNQLNVNNEYIITADMVNNTGISIVYDFASIEPINFKFPTDLGTFNGIQIYGDTSQYHFRYYYNDTILNYPNQWTTNVRSFKIKLNSVYANGNTALGGKVQLLIPTGETLDNAFYYGVNKMTESSLFNWTQNTAIYTPINTMTTQLGITTPAIAILITYWFILIVIYIVLDIVLKCFTMISHLIFRSS